MATGVCIRLDEKLKIQLSSKFTKRSCSLTESLRIFMDVILLANIVRYMLSPVRLSSVCLSSVTLVHPAQAIVIFGNISTALGTLAIR